MSITILITLFCLMLMCISSALVGCFTYLRKQSLIGDVVAHSTLPGVCVAYLFAQTKNPLYLLLGAFIAGLIAIYTVEFILNNSKLKSDASLAIVLSTFFSLGILVLTIIQHSSMGGQSGLDTFLFGKVAALTEEDLLLFTLLTTLIVLMVILFYKEFVLFTFDKTFAESIGRPVKFYQLAITVVTVLAIVIGINTVGVILMASLLITPASAARFWSNNLISMIILAVLLSVISGMVGTYISFIDEHMPTGPAIVVVLAGIALLSFIFAPQKGILYREIQRLKNKQKISEENIIKALYQMGELYFDFYKNYTFEQIELKRSFDRALLKRSLNKLRSKGYIIRIDNTWAMTKEGKNLGQRITRLHRLWELYLSKNLMLSPDHVHEDAETIEHLITPELEEKLMQELGYPILDPHQMKIPYKES